MDIPVSAEVKCADGVCGRLTYVIVDPVTRQVTHVVVKERGFPHTERLVPVELVLESTPHFLRLRCTEAGLAALEPFSETDYIREEIPYFDKTVEAYLMRPYFVPVTTMVPVEHSHVPPGEVAVRRGARVEAIDGRVGQVDEFLVDPQNDHITHLVLREGHWWGQKDVTIPVSQIDRIKEDTVYLKLDKHSIERLPALPVHRGAMP